ncbi:unnamed protein product [Durusdinium trenchii]|uniref:Uncharacterized protein n=1 Tax=Durusdinium trenchii TaxID=1381693 RepID=A0ABP0QMG7_9DINO
MRLLAFLAPVAALLLDGSSKARPVSKVVQLLQSMKVQLETEAAEEAELMEKHTCWCKENGEAKEKAILEAQAHIEARCQAHPERCRPLCARNGRAASPSSKRLVHAWKRKFRPCKKRSTRTRLPLMNRLGFARKK